MKASSKIGALVYNFGIPAFLSKTGLKTCPNAGTCAIGCYARQGTYAWSNVNQAYEARLKVTQQVDFIATIQLELLKLTKHAKSKKLWIRVHDSGDFYSRSYQLAWYAIASDFPEIEFYAYTKQVQQSKELEVLRPNNFRLIYSFGGKQDHLIDANTDRHSKVFQYERELIKQGYKNASNDDLIAPINLKIGLVYHGAKSFKNTKWGNS